MASQWLYQTSEGRPSGPVDSTQLRRLAEAGVVRPETLVCQGASDRWVRAEKVPGLFQRSTPAPSSSPGASPPKPPPVQESGAPPSLREPWPPGHSPPPSPVQESGAPSRGVSGESPIRHSLDAAEVNEASEKPERVWARDLGGDHRRFRNCVAPLVVGPGVPWRERAAATGGEGPTGVLELLEPNGTSDENPIVRAAAGDSGSDEGSVVNPRSQDP
jgi:hypothetical protein